MLLISEFHNNDVSDALRPVTGINVDHFAEEDEGRYGVDTRLVDGLVVFVVDCDLVLEGMKDGGKKLAMVQ